MKLYYIAVYDITKPGRLQRILKIFRRYMYWIQNSVFEGELNDTQFKCLNAELKQVMKKDEDSIIFFSAEHKKYIAKKIIGIEKNEVTAFF
jgi:CRISPR-associated protein Cas2